jgi:SAM-dependent methyltransferase
MADPKPDFITNNASARRVVANHSERLLERSILERFASSLSDEARILDYGCGSGWTTRFLYNQGKKGIVGLDISMKAIEQARTKHKGTAFELDSILASKFANESADGILAFYALVRFSYREIAKGLCEWRRLLKPGGRLLFSFHVGKKSGRAKGFSAAGSSNSGWNVFDPDRIVALVRASGFTLEEALIRFPDSAPANPSKRCYVFATRK